MFSHSDCSQNIFVELKIIVISSEFDFFRKKGKNAGRFRKNSGRKAKCGISRTIAGWLTPMLRTSTLSATGTTKGGVALREDL